MMKFNYKKSLGQNFLQDNNIIDKISSAINPSSNDLIVEIGPGAGALTKKLVNKNCDVLCFEIDTRLEEYLLNINSTNLRVVFSDFLKVNLDEYIDYDKYNKIYFVGNLPYYITTAIINKIVNESRPEEIVIMVQKEVGDRFMASPSTKQYGSLSVFLQYNFNISKVCNVSKHCFEPVPNVDSVVIKFSSKDKLDVFNKDHFYKLIKDSFVQKRKNLKNNLYNYDLDIINNTLALYNKDITFRAETLSVEEFVSLSNALFSKKE